MFTRKQYMDNECSHQQYYGELVEASGIKITDAKLVAQVQSALAKGDQHLNSIALGMWDGMATNNQHAMRPALKARGDFYSLGGGVCIMKEAARRAASGG